MPEASGSELERACAQVMSGCACEGVRRAARQITRHYERALAPSGVRATQLPILVALGAVGPVPLTPLAERLAIDRTTLIRNLGVLEARGLVESAEDEGDRRRRLPRLTAEGRRVLGQALALWGEAQAAVQARFGRPRLGALSGELSALAEALEG